MKNKGNTKRNIRSSIGKGRRKVGKGGEKCVSGERSKSEELLKKEKNRSRITGRRENTEGKEAEGRRKNEISRKIRKESKKNPE